ncbi:hypothetical protein ENSA5_48950 [Enhygromyxa salina]|uniref:Uncharacterized protein n=1 Tax=Enhygromyxa salina TaxID=215803 RepID=A0A2S9XI20_9BACT|nr:ribulose phosphate epimerase [Enhygromyxa salina]PRP92477.1 hypothetical protein ENSA5_48950 [Enhygromyxa salina]
MTTRPRDPSPRPTRTPRSLAAALGLLLGLGLASGCSSKELPDPNLDGGDDSGTSDDTDPGTESADQGIDSGDGDTDTGSNDTGFVPMTDGISTNTCDPAEQDCPAGEKCTGYVVQPGYCCVDANKCVSVIGSGQLGDPCVRTEDNDDCDLGLFCMTVSSGSTGDGVCLAFCDVGTQDCADDGLPDANCIAFNDGTLPLCQDSCDPITQDCDGSLGCYGVGAQGFVCSVPGYEDGLGNAGDSCYTIQSCKPGLGCTAAEVLQDCGGSRCCTPYCDLSEPDPCEAPEQCTAYYELGTAPPGYENVGICALPA